MPRGVRRASVVVSLRRGAVAPDRLLRTSAKIYYPYDRELLGAEVIDASTGRVLLDALGAVYEAFAPRGPPHDPSWQPFAARHPRLDEDRRKLLIAQTRDASIVGQVAHLLRCELEPPFRAALPPGEFTALGWLGEHLVVASADERGRVAPHGAASPGAPFVEWLRVPTGVGRPRRVLVERSPAGRHVAFSFIHKRGINFGGEVHRWMTWFDASLLP